MINNRQNGRRRGRGGQQVRGGQPGNQDRGNRIDNRARGNAAQLLEKYKSLARDAQMQGDRVNTEYYLQFADHYFRVLSESRIRFEEQRPDQRGRREDYGDEGDGANSFDQGDGWEGDEERGPPMQPMQARDNERRPAPEYRQQEPRQPEPRQERQPDRQPDRRYEERGQDAGATQTAPEERASEAEARPRRAPRRRDAGNGNGERGDAGGHAAPAAAAPAAERIEVDRLPQAFGAPPPAAAAPEDGAEEAPAPRRRAPRRPRSSEAGADA